MLRKAEYGSKMSQGDVIWLHFSLGKWHTRSTDVYVFALQSA